MTYLEAQTMPAPDWSSRPWGRPTVHAANSEVNARLVGTAEFRYHGIRVRGVRIFKNDDGTLSVNMPQKRFGDVIESVFYFVDPLESEQFSRDIAWLWQSVFGRRKQRTLLVNATDTTTPEVDPLTFLYNPAGDTK